MTATAPPRTSTVPAGVLRGALAAAATASWVTSGAWQTSTSTSPPTSPLAVGPVGLLLVGLGVAGVAAVTARPHTRLPAVFLLVVLAVRVLLGGPGTGVDDIASTVAFVLAVVATHCLCGVCAVLDGPGDVQVRALLPGARRFLVVSVAAAGVLTITAVASPGAVGRPGSAAVAAAAAGTLIATVAVITANARR